MDRLPVDALLVGRDERAARRFLFLVVGVAASTFGVLTVGRPLWEGVLDVSGLVFSYAYLVGTGSIAGAYAFRNDGWLVTLFGTFVLLLGLSVASRLTALCALGGVGSLGGVGCTLAGDVLFGVGLAAGVAVPLGCITFAVGAGGRRLSERRAAAP